MTIYDAKGGQSGFICCYTQITLSAVFGTMMPKWLHFSLMKLTKNWQYLANNGFKLHINLTSGTRGKFALFGSCTSNGLRGFAHQRQMRRDFAILVERINFFLVNNLSQNFKNYRVMKSPRIFKKCR